MAGWTNKGKALLLDIVFNSTAAPTNFYAHLVNSTPDQDDNTMADLTESSNYSAISLTKNTTDFPSLAEDDTNDRGSINVKQLTFTASGGTLTATHMVLTDDNVTTSAREVYAYWSLGGSQSVSDGQDLIVGPSPMQANES